MAETRAPAGKLSIVATPIGNLGDITMRALETLKAADAIAAEDTRQTAKLLGHYQIRKPLISYHDHSTAKRTEDLLARLAAGARIALVSDAGTPGISDPGADLIGAAIAAGIPVEVLPGPAAVIAALVGSGLPTDRFTFEGFLPRKGAARQTALAAIRHEGRTVVLYEAPARLADTLADLAKAQPERLAAVARELTKLHETFHRGSLQQLAESFAAQPARGECVIVLAPAPPAEAGGDLRSAVAAGLRAGLSPAAAAKQAAAALGGSRQDAYRLALELQQEPG